jgi:AraC-like DNA-binding protein
MPFSSDHDIAEVLDAAAAQWAEIRAWKVVCSEGEAAGARDLKNGAFVYRWNVGGGAVEVSFSQGWKDRVTAAEGQVLAIGQRDNFLYVSGAGRGLMKVPCIDPSLAQQVGELLSEARLLTAPGSKSCWTRDFALIASAMRLPLLLRAAAVSARRDRAVGDPSAKDQLAVALHEWLRPNLGKSVRLADAARHFQKSPRQLIRLLKETTGAGFAEHLTLHRLTLARALLMRNGHSVMEVALASGFNSREQFIRAFSKAFGWTPLQFRKAWSEAALANGDLAPLCQVSERGPVEWLAAGAVAVGPPDEDPVGGHTLVVANALHEIAELFRMDASGKGWRIEVLERGGMAFVSRDPAGSVWRVRIPSTGEERCFRTRGDHALAVIEPRG